MPGNSKTIAQAVTAVLVAAFAWMFKKNRQREAAVSWKEAEQILDSDWLDAFQSVYDATVADIKAKFPQAVKHSAFSRRVYIHPGPFPRPYTEQWGVAFPEHEDGGNPGGNIVLLRGHKNNMTLWRHESAHLITGITEHPQWLFQPSGLGLRV